MSADSERLIAAGILEQVERERREISRWLAQRAMERRVAAVAQILPRPSLIGVL